MFQTQEKQWKLTVSLRGHKEVDYSPMLMSGLDSEPESGCKKPKNHQPSANGPSATRQRANRHTGISTTFQTKMPLHSYPIRGYKKPSNASNNIPSNALSVETDYDTQPPTPQVETDDVLEYVETENSSVHMEMSPPSKGTLVTRSYELKRYKQPRQFKCKLCGESTFSVKELNAHHCSTHDVQFCDNCGKGFSMKSTLEKHLYVHKELRYICDRCGMGFPFESHLAQHKIIHHTYPSLKCMKKNCERHFKNVGHLNRHIKQHKQGAWYYCDFCDYKNKDKCNRDSHQWIHVVGDEKYNCQICKEHFRFSTQWLRHIKKGCVPLPRSASPVYD